jgi:hypothetical protein
MGYQPYMCAPVRLTTSGDVSDAGKPVLICGYGVESGATAAQPVFRNGAYASTGAAVFTPGPITVSQGNVGQLAILPVMFTTGCNVSFDANTTAVTVFYILQSVTS